jgi:hypothetical protein
MSRWQPSTYGTATMKTLNDYIADQATDLSCPSSKPSRSR